MTLVEVEDATAPTEARTGAGAIGTPRVAPPERPLRREATTADMGAPRRPRARTTFSGANVVSRSFGIWGRNLVAYTLLSLIVFLPLYAYTGLKFSGSLSSLPAWLHQSIDMLGDSLLGYIVTATVIYGVLQQLRGHRPPLGDCISYGLSRLGSVLGVGFVVAGISVVFAIPIGFFNRQLAELGGLVAVLVVLSSVVLLLWVVLGLYVAIPVAVIERPGVFKSLARSWSLTKGFRWKLLWMTILIGLTMVPVRLALHFLLVKDSPEALAWSQLGTTTLFASLWAVMSAIAYHDLRHLADGTDTEELAAIFD